MEDFKIQFFEKEYNKKFIHFEHLTDYRCEVIRKNIFRVFFEKNKIIVGMKGVGFIEEFKNVEDVLKKINVSPKNKIYINWFNFENIDYLKYKDFVEYFDDLWFPASDDIDVFDDTFEWILSIRHDGYITYLTVE